MTPLKRLERMLSYLFMWKRVNNYHAKNHDMASDTGSLGIVDLHGSLGPQLPLVDEIETTSNGISHSS